MEARSGRAADGIGSDDARPQELFEDVADGLHAFLIASSSRVSKIMRPISSTFSAKGRLPCRSRQRGMPRDGSELELARPTMANFVPSISQTQARSHRKPIHPPGYRRSSRNEEAAQMDDHPRPDRRSVSTEGSCRGNHGERTPRPPRVIVRACPASSSRFPCWCFHLPPNLNPCRRKPRKHRRSSRPGRRSSLKATSPAADSGR